MKTTIQIGNGKPVILERENTEVSSTESRIMEWRAFRNNLLALSDDYVLPDRGLSDQNVSLWKTYRQSLRDMDFSDPNNLTWPIKPE